MNAYRDSKENGVKRKFSSVELKISLFRALMLGVLCVFLLIWAFFIGILVGRGENPESMVPEIAALMPSQNETTPEPVTKPEKAAASMDKILQPENLDFMGNLKTKPTNDDLTNAPLATNIPPKKVKPANPAVETKPVVQPQASGSHGQVKPVVKVKPEEGVFDYVYQVAASTDKKGAEGLKSKLAARGIDAFVLEAQKDSGKIYRINVRFRGTPEDTRQFSKKLEEAGMDRKILVTKKPAAN